jgi:hypothetical protein
VESCQPETGSYLDIAHEARIVSVFTMHIGNARISATLCTVELFTGALEHRNPTDQSAFFDGRETPSERKSGWEANAGHDWMPKRWREDSTVVRSGWLQ